MLTVCLITQGRTQVSDFLDSLEVIASLDFINVLIIDNASPVTQSMRLKSWASAHANSFYIRRETNTTNWNELWSQFNAHLSQWVVFPGDDDRLILEGILEWKRIVTTNPNLDAVAMSAKIIRSDGSITRDFVFPEYIKFGVGASAVSRALHCPPFFWPSLFIKSDEMKPPFPISRFVLDWCFGIGLVMNQKLMTSEVASIEYRRHDTQESSLASSNRKMFEGVYWLNQLINSKKFLNWVDLQSSKEIEIFWNSLMIFPPIYGEKDLSDILIFRLATIIQDSRHGHILQNQIFVDLSRRVSALQHDEAIRESLEVSEEDLNVFGNLNVENDVSECPVIASLVSSFTGAENAVKVKVCCKHLKIKPGIKVHCDSYVSLPRKQALDALVRDISSALEFNGELAFRISPLERKFIVGLRKYKSFVPTSITRYVRRHE
jgi:hypothetical protein